MNLLYIDKKHLAVEIQAIFDTELSTIIHMYVQNTILSCSLINVYSCMLVQYKTHFNIICSANLTHHISVMGSLFTQVVFDETI